MSKTLPSKLTQRHTYLFFTQVRVERTEAGLLHRLVEYQVDDSSEQLWILMHLVVTELARKVFVSRGSDFVEKASEKVWMMLYALYSAVCLFLTSAPSLCPRSARRRPFDRRASLPSSASTRSPTSLASLPCSLLALTAGPWEAS